MYGFRRSPQSASPHLYLHFDINGTLIAVDSASNDKGIHDVVSTSIASRYKAVWGPEVTQPINFYNYVKNFIFVLIRSDPKRLKNSRRRSFATRSISLKNEDSRN